MFSNLLCTYINIDDVVLHRKRFVVKVFHHIVDVMVRLEINFTLEHNEVPFEYQRHIKRLDNFDLNLQNEQEKTFCTQTRK